jgi:maltooligosyltrehalose trehalohydrolase
MDGRFAHRLPWGADRGGRRRGEPSAHLPPTAFIDFLQNHDQVGNRAGGERITSLAPSERVEAALAVLLLSPHIPLLFMGEEYGERRPFQFFTDFKSDLAEAVRKGRSEEFRNNQAFAEAFAQNIVPDPNSPETFAASRLSPARSRRGDAAARAIKSPIQTRFAHIVPKLPKIGGHAGKVEAIDRAAFTLRWRCADGGALKLSANFADKEARLPESDAGTLIFAHPEGAAAALAQGRLPPWSVVASMTGRN